MPTSTAELERLFNEYADAEQLDEFQRDEITFRWGKRTKEALLALLQYQETIDELLDYNELSSMLESVDFFNSPEDLARHMVKRTGYADDLIDEYGEDAVNYQAIAKHLMKEPQSGKIHLQGSKEKVYWIIE